jgi:hypothetical protein
LFDSKKSVGHGTSPHPEVSNLLIYFNVNLLFVVFHPNK